MENVINVFKLFVDEHLDELEKDFLDQLLPEDMPIDDDISDYIDNNYDDFIAYCKKEFKGALEDEGYYIERTSKKIGEEWVSGRFIIGLNVRDAYDVRDTNSHQICIYRDLSEISVINDINDTKKKKNNTTEILKTTLIDFIGKNQTKDGISSYSIYENFDIKLIDPIIDKLLKNGEIFEPKSGYYMVN